MCSREAKRNEVNDSASLWWDGLRLSPAFEENKTWLGSKPGREVLHHSLNSPSFPESPNLWGQAPHTRTLCIHVHSWLFVGEIPVQQTNSLMN